VTDHFEGRLRQWSKELGNRLDGMAAGLESIGSMLPVHLPQQRSRTDLRPLRASLIAFVQGAVPLCDGAGIAFAQSELADAEFWLEWWRIGPHGERFQPHTLNPQATGFYDYTNQGWYCLPAVSRAPTLVGPYLDNGGTNLRVVTLARPLMREGEPFAVIACDLALAALERSLVRAVGQDRPVALINPSGKIVVTNSPVAVGRNIARTTHKASVSGMQPITVSMTRMDSGWTIVLPPDSFA